MGPSLEHCFNDMKSCTEGLKNKVFTAASKAKKIDRNCRPLLNDDLEKMQEERKKIDHEEGVIRKNKLVLEQIMLERVRSRGTKQREIERIKNSPKDVKWLVSALALINTRSSASERHQTRARKIKKKKKQYQQKIQSRGSKSKRRNKKLLLTRKLFKLLNTKTTN